jgi:hypothetical protein
MWSSLDLREGRVPQGWSTHITRSTLSRYGWDSWVPQARGPHTYCSCGGRMKSWASTPSTSSARVSPLGQ